MGDLTGQLQLQSHAAPPSGQEHWHEQGMLSPVGGMGGIPDPDPVPVIGTGSSPDPDPVIGSGVAPDPDPVGGIGPDPDPVAGPDPDPVAGPGSVGSTGPGSVGNAPPSWQLETVHFPLLHFISSSKPSTSTTPFPPHFLSHLALAVQGSLGTTVKSQVQSLLPSLISTPVNFTAKLRSMMIVTSRSPATTLIMMLCWCS